MNIITGEFRNLYIALKLSDAFGVRDLFWSDLIEQETPESIKNTSSIAIRFFIKKELQPLSPDSAVFVLSRILENANWDNLGINFVNDAYIGQSLDSIKPTLINIINDFSLDYIEKIFNEIKNEPEIEQEDEE
jgi:hypothetical protein